jgi:hypothetical protein
MLKKVISGGQTGVDRGALDAALGLGITAGGHCPRGRRAEDGRIPDRYPVTELPSSRYAARTAENVRNADGTLVLIRGELEGGSALTVELADRYHKPCLIVDLDAPDRIGRVRRWLAEFGIGVLNVAGPRESRQPGIEAQAADFLRCVLAPPV